MRTIETNKLQNTYQSLRRFDIYALLFKHLPAVYRNQDAILHLVVLFILGAALSVRVINHFTANYTAVGSLHSLVGALPGLAIVWAVGMLSKARYPRVGLFLTSFSLVFLSIKIFEYGGGSIITTPFLTIDSHLVYLDQLMGVNTASLLQWTHNHLYFKSILGWAYSAYFWELIFTPLVLAFFKDEIEINRFLVATFVSFFIAGLIYYLLPTIAPAGVVSSPYFLQNQHDLVLRFFQVHASLPVTVWDGGLVAFPSCHIINTTIVLIAWRKRKVFFYPLLVLNILLMLATIFLGYHYLVDVIAGYAIAFLSYYLAKMLLNCRVLA